MLSTLVDTLTFLLQAPLVRFPRLEPRPPPAGGCRVHVHEPGHRRVCARHDEGVQQGAGRRQQHVPVLPKGIYSISGTSFVVRCHLTKGDAASRVISFEEKMLKILITG